MIQHHFQLFYLLLCYKDAESELLSFPPVQLCPGMLPESKDKDS